MADNRGGGGEDVDNPNAGHPLLNPVVASRLFEVVTLPELRTLRLVCKDWYSVSLPIWRRTLQINIHEESSNPRLLQWKSLGTKLDVAREQPFRYFRLHSPHFLAPNSEPCSKYGRTRENFQGSYRNMEKFWAKYGHWIHKLELHQVYVTDWDAFERAIFKQTPNLQELTLDRMTVKRDRGADTGARTPLQVDTIKGEADGPAEPNPNLKAFALKDYNRSRMLPFQWRLLFNIFPNIEKLELAVPEMSVEEFVGGVEEMLRNPARRPNLSITDLRLKAFETDPDIVRRILRMPLVKLKVLHAEGKLDIFETAMQFHGNTLKELHLHNEYNSMDFWGSQVGPYPNLTELQMEGSAYSFNFHFLNKLPNLKVLRLKQLDEDEMLSGTNWTTLEKMPQLREFYFIVTEPDYEDYDLPEEILERFAEVMPNLESFTGQLDNLTLRVVCRNWIQLRKLVILSGKDFEGMDPPEGIVMAISDVGITGIVRGSDERVPCIADLQELRYLTLEHVTLIGNASVVEGFLKLPHLAYLDICESNKISKKVLKSLKGRLQGGLTITPLW